MFPEGASVITNYNLDDSVDIKAEMPKEPALPEWATPPVPEWMKSVLHTQGLLSNLNMISRGIPYIPPSSYKNTYFFENFPFNHNTVSKSTQKLSHHELWPITPMVVYLPPDTREGFSIQYLLYADEILELIDGELKVTWE